MPMLFAEAQVGGGQDGVQRSGPAVKKFDTGKFGCGHNFSHGASSRTR